MYKWVVFFIVILSVNACNNLSNNNQNSSIHFIKDSSRSSATTTNTTTTPTTTATPPPPPATVAYRLVTSKDSIRKLYKFFPAGEIPLLIALNRADSDHITHLSSILVPADSNYTGKYTPFPQNAPFLQNVQKVIFFSYPAEYFGAYENGRLVYSGPTNMGREKDSTPTGLFFTNWKAEDTHSTFNDEWDLKWNVNIDNKAGIGWHQYSMPGYPVSHSCLRLTTNDAQDLYKWADEWINGKSGFAAQGTPVVIFGTYPFGQKQKPWMQLAENPHALDIPVDELQKEAQPFMSKIMEEQQRRTAYVGKHRQ